MPRASAKSTSTKKNLLERIKRLEEAMAKAQEYLNTGKHANWQGFRPLFSTKVRDGQELPPHPDWVKNVFLTQTRVSLKEAERALETLELKTREPKG